MKHRVMKQTQNATKIIFEISKVEKERVRRVMDYLGLTTLSSFCRIALFEKTRQVEAVQN